MTRGTLGKTWTVLPEKRWKRPDMVGQKQNTRKIHIAAGRHGRGKCGCFRSLSIEHRAKLSKASKEAHARRKDEGLPAPRGLTWSEESRQRGSIAQKGRVISEQAREKLAESFRLRTQKTSDTWMERALDWVLEQAGLCYEKQKRFGRFVVDAWLPEERLVFEADGNFWHQDKERETRRDEYLMDHGALAVVHFRTEDLLPVRKELR